MTDHPSKSSLKKNQIKDGSELDNVKVLFSTLLFDVE